MHAPGIADVIQRIGIEQQQVGFAAHFDGTGIGAEKLGGRVVGDGSLRLAGIASPASAGPHDLAVVTNGTDGLERCGAVGGDMIECLDLEATHHVHTGLTQDHRAAVQAFVDKKAPTFKGQIFMEQGSTG